MANRAWRRAFFAVAIAMVFVGIVLSFYGGAVEGGSWILLVAGLLLVFVGIALGARARVSARDREE